MARLSGALLIIFLVLDSVSSHPAPWQYSPIEATVEIGEGEGAGADGIDVGLEVGLISVLTKVSIKSQLFSDLWLHWML